MTIAEQAQQMINISFTHQETAEQKAEREEAELIAELEARAQVAMPDPATMAEANALQEKMSAAYERVVELRRTVHQRLIEASRKQEELKQAAEKKKRWRMYQVWRIVDDQGITDWTPNHDPRYAIKEVGQVINFAEDNDTLNMCRNGTHSARFLHEAVISYHGKRAVRLELEGWVSHDHYFRCETAKVLAIVDLADILGKSRSEPKDMSRADAFAQYSQPGPHYINPGAGSTSQADHWRNWLIRNHESPYHTILAKLQADDTYLPGEAELNALFLQAQLAEAAQGMFKIRFARPEPLVDLRVYFERAINNVRNPAVVQHPDGCDSIQREAQLMVLEDLEKKARAYLAEHYPDVQVKDFGVKRGQDPLSRNAEFSKAYWMYS